MADKRLRISTYTDHILNKGRSEIRSISVSNCLDGISNDWIGLKELVKVERMTRRNGCPQKETAYFISSLRASASMYHEGIRLHWEIENSLHWVKDVTFFEDASKIRTKEAPQNISTLKNIVINVFRKNQFKNMAEAKRLVSNHIIKMKQLII